MPAPDLTTWPRWAVMWTLAGTIFVACKLLTWLRTPAPGATPRRQVAYFFLWPGLDAAAFLNPAPLSQKRRPGIAEWLFAGAKAAFGATLVWGAVPAVSESRPLFRGWLGMTGLIFLLHFGTFHLLSCVWRAAGVDAKPLMNWPVRSASLSEFWGKRWNTAFRDLTHRFLFAPLARRLGPRAGLAAGFLFSGIVHDLVISAPAGGGYGLPTLYFVAQGFGLLAERSKFGHRLGLGRGVLGWGFTALVVAGPAPALFHTPFVTDVVLPFLAALGAH